MRNTKNRRWLSSDVQRLRDAYAAGGFRTALAAFPELTDSAVDAALARFGMRDGNRMLPGPKP